MSLVTVLQKQIEDSRKEVDSFIKEYRGLPVNDAREQHFVSLFVFWNNQIDCPGTATVEDAIAIVQMQCSGRLPAANDPMWNEGWRHCANQLRAWHHFENAEFSITREVIESTHALLVEGDRVAIGLRQSTATSANGAAVYADHTQLPQLLDQWIIDVNDAISDVNVCPFHTSAFAMTTFLRLHPFEDGNGRLSRIIANGILRRLGFPLLIIPRERRYLKSVVWDQKQCERGGGGKFLCTTRWMLESSIETLVAQLRSEWTME